MSQKQIIETSDAPKPVGPYSQAVKLGNLLFCSGQIAIDPTTNQVLTGDVKVQTKQVMENIGGLLKASRAKFEDIVKTTIFLKRMSDFATVNEIYATYFTSEFPARSTVEVSGLPKGVDVEIEVVVNLG